MRLLRAELDADALGDWIEAGWLAPGSDREMHDFSETDLARAMLIRDLKEKLENVLKTEREGVVSVPDLAEALSARGYLVRLESGQARECGKACGRQCLEKLQHTYLIVSGSLDSAVTVCSRLSFGMFQEKST